MTLHEFLIGTIIGDACIAKKNKGARYHRWSCGHGESQLKYLEWKVDFLKQHDLHTGNITKCVSTSNRYKKPCTSYHTKSRTKEIFDEYRGLIYPNNVKIIPKIDFTPQMLSLLYMDDGHLLRRKTYYKDKIYHPTPKAIFNLHSFNDEDREYLCDQFDKFDIKATSRHKNGEVAISAYSMSDFKKLITVLPIFDYKMGPV